MKCDKCGNECDEAEVEAISLNSGDKIICRECMLDMVHMADSAGLMEWQEESLSIEIPLGDLEEVK